jgi:hypothetical protein
VRPLPDGDQYLGFVFAAVGAPDEVEKALTAASQRLHPVINFRHPGAGAPSRDGSWAVPSGFDGANGAARQYQAPKNGRCRYPCMRETSG